MGISCFGGARCENFRVFLKHPKMKSPEMGEVLMFAECVYMKLDCIKTLVDE